MHEWYLPAIYATPYMCHKVMCHALCAAVNVQESNSKKNKNVNQKSKKEIQKKNQVQVQVQLNSKSKNFQSPKVKLENLVQ